MVSVKIPGPQNRFILGPALSSSTLSSRVVSSPVKSRWSRHATRNSPTKSQYSQIRNRSYALAVSPQKKPPVTRSRRKSMESKITDNGSSQESGMFSPNESNSLLPGPPKRKVRKGNPPKSPTKSTRRAQRYIYLRTSICFSVALWWGSCQWWDLLLMCIQLGWDSLYPVWINLEG